MSFLNSNNQFSKSLWFMTLVMLTFAIIPIAIYRYNSIGILLPILIIGAVSIVIIGGLFGYKKLFMYLFFTTLAFNIEFPIYPFGGGYSDLHPSGLRGALVVNHFFLIIIVLFVLHIKPANPIQKAKIEKNFPIEKIFLLCFLITGILSSFLAVNKAAAAYPTVRLVFMYLLVTLLMKMELQNVWKVVINSIIIVIPVQFLIGLGQYITGQPVGLRFLGESKNPFRADTVFGLAERGLSGTLGHPGIFASFICFILPLLINSYLNSNKLKLKINKILFFTILIAIISIILTNARTSIALMALVFFISFIGNLYIKKINGESNKKLVGIISLVALCIPIILYYFSDSLLERFLNSDLSYQADYRGGLNQISYSIIFDNFRTFFLGVGPNNYTDILVNKGSGFAYTQPVHNLYLLLLAEGGIIHLISYLLMLFSIGFKMFKVINSKSKHAFQALSVLTSAITMSIYNFTGWANYNNQNFIFFIILLALSFKIYDAYKTEE